MTQKMNKISSLQSLSDYGLGDSDIEDSDNENEEKSSATVTKSFDQPRLPRVVSGGNSRLVSYGDEEDEDTTKIQDVEKMVVEDSKSPVLVPDNEEVTTQATENREGNGKDANENNVERLTEVTDIRFSHPNVVLPPEPTGRCSNSVQKRIVDSLESKKRNATDFNAKIQKMKDFRNPSIYEKLVSFLNIQENGTNYPATLYDPEAWMKEPNYEVLAKQQKEAYEKKEKEKAKRTQIQFLSGTKKSTTEITAPTVEEAKKRKSKWDISASSAPVVSVPMLAKAISDATSSAAKKAKS